MKSKVAVSGLALLLTACAIPPDVKDFAKVDTYEIVRRVRCEMRDAVRGRVVASLRHHDPASAAKLRTDDDWLKFSSADLNPKARAIFNIYKDTLIGYEFSFDITENNNATAHADILHTFTKGTLGLGVEGTANRERNNLELFRNVDSFSKLVKVGGKYCFDKEPKGKDFAYPIKSDLNLADYVRKFLDLNQSGNLADTKDGKDVAKYTFTLKFTTELTGKLAPDLKLPTRGNLWEITGVNASVANTRKDIHQVAFVFILPAAGDTRGPTIAEDRVNAELDYLRTRNDLRYFGTRNAF